MIIDKNLEFSDAQAVTVDAASTNYIDTQKVGRAIDELFLKVSVNTTFDSASDNGTLTIKLQTDDNSSFLSATDLFTSAIFAQTALVAGKTLVNIRLPFGLERYIRLYYDNGTEAFTAGKIDAVLVSGTELGL